jgi:pimeloyl-ACP methyl ester carboxylesterase
MPDLTPDRSGHVTSGDQRIYYEYFGAGDREVVCLLNGLAMSTASWYHFVGLLEDSYDVLLWDYQGQGRSSCDDIPYTIPGLCHYLTQIVDELGIERFHLMGISYGGFIALEYARLYQERLDTLTVSGILLTEDRLFEMYEDISLRFYRGGPEAFELYTHYMYEKIFSERFVRTLEPEQLEKMRQNFYDRYWDKTHCLIRLTEAQDPFFAALEENDAGYRAIQTPTLILAGDQDRAIPPWVQRKLCDILPNTRFVLAEECGHVVYLERAAFFFDNLKRFARAKTVDFELA